MNIQKSHHFCVIQNGKAKEIRNARFVTIECKEICKEGRMHI
jgi:hypothetical protein